MRSRYDWMDEGETHPDDFHDNSRTPPIPRNQYVPCPTNITPTSRKLPNPRPRPSRRAQGLGPPKGDQSHGFGLGPGTDFLFR
ncbi:putative oxidoreductase YusZ [Fusarium oxysporum f. sp. albedinis]|nr:putative oxidoreductase YusZ [Fusarium oxysporum f. sp. albedinis]